MSIIPVRASVVGSGINVSTPNIVSFYIRVSKGELSTFSFSVKQSTSGAGAGGMVSFYMQGNLIYTGILTSLKVRPCFEDPAYHILDGNGTDVRMLLQGKTFTRRNKQESTGWCVITGVVRKGPRSSKLMYSTGSSEGSFVLSPGPLKAPKSPGRDILNETRAATPGLTSIVDPVIAYAIPVALEE